MVGEGEVVEVGLPDPRRLRRGRGGPVCDSPQDHDRTSISSLCLASRDSPLIVADAGEDRQRHDTLLPWAGTRRPPQGRPPRDPCQDLGHSLRRSPGPRLSESPVRRCSGTRAVAMWPDRAHTGVNGLVICTPAPPSRQQPVRSLGSSRMSSCSRSMTASATTRTAWVASSGSTRAAPRSTSPARPCGSPRRSAR